ncbi:MAG: DUF5337 family protein [Gemmobacter sp.]
MTDAPDPRLRARVAQVRVAAVVLAATMLLWMVAQWAGGRLGWQVRYVFLFDMMAMAAFAWTMVVTWRLWQSRQR